MKSIASQTLLIALNFVSFVLPASAAQPPVVRQVPELHILGNQVQGKMAGYYPVMCYNAKGEAEDWQKVSWVLKATVDDRPGLDQFTVTFELGQGYCENKNAIINRIDESGAVDLSSIDAGDAWSFYRSHYILNEEEIAKQCVNNNCFSQLVERRVIYDADINANVFEVKIHMSKKRTFTLLDSQGLRYFRGRFIISGSVLDEKGEVTGDSGLRTYLWQFAFKLDEKGRVQMFANSLQ